MSLRKIFSLLNIQQSEPQTEDKQEDKNNDKNDFDVETIMSGADMGSCGVNGPFFSNPPSGPTSTEEPSNDNQKGLTQEETEELIRQNFLNPF